MKNQAGLVLLQVFLVSVLILMRNALRAIWCLMKELEVQLTIPLPLPTLWVYFFGHVLFEKSLCRDLNNIFLPSPFCRW